MNLALYKIKTMCGQEFEVEAFTSGQAITLWTGCKPKDLLFRSCTLLKSSAEIDRYWTLKSLAEPSKNDRAEVSLIVENFRATDLYKKNKKRACFITHPVYIE